MAFYAEDEEIWRCPTHPSKRRKTGICPTCLRERLTSLCPDCAQLRPCSCCPTTASSSSSSSSGDSSVSKLLESEPSFRRSRSLAVPFFRSRFPEKESSVRSKSSFFRSVFSTPKREMPDVEGSVPRNMKFTKEERTAGVEEENKVKEERERMMLRSRSVGMAALFSRGSRRGGSGSVGGSVGGCTGEDSGKPPKAKGWNFPSPMKALRQSHKASKISQDRSPMYRG